MAMHNPQLPNREAVARASAWLRECSKWMLSHDLDMRGDCPMQADPLDLADDLDAALALIPSPDQGEAERFADAGKVIGAPVDSAKPGEVSPPERMTAETAPEWLRELTPEHYAQRRNDEIDSVLWSLEIHGGSWVKLAASMLHSAGSMSPEFGSYSHGCLIVAEQLTKVAALSASLPEPQLGVER